MQRAEDQDRANLEHLMTIAHRASMHDDADPFVDLIRRHVEREYGVSVPRTFAHRHEIVRWADRASRRAETMPDWLFYGRRPPALSMFADGTIREG